MYLKVMLFEILQHSQAIIIIIQYNSSYQNKTITKVILRVYERYRPCYQCQTFFKKNSERDLYIIPTSHNLLQGLIV